MQSLTVDELSKPGDRINKEFVLNDFTREFVESTFKTRRTWSLSAELFLQVELPAKIPFLGLFREIFLLKTSFENSVNLGEEQLRYKFNEGIAGLDTDICTSHDLFI
ncbi:hypothetical protein C468_14138 [Halorubrum kocurii JCM 14978]|uniref:Uncharacterized protein n=1 Tax=Halorubrum kocurii JCM 14978 TaxID=1230456 RepID=M0NQP7_9EURY|nr:hypothetical protein C468_14138 [Halorubrum kocurii JCM 14978]